MTDRYQNWTEAECHSKECLHAHERAATVVDAEALRELLTAMLAQMMAADGGREAGQLADPLPSAA